MKRKAWIVGLAALLLLTGCNPDGGAFLEVVYPSGCARTYRTNDELTPVEGTDCQLRAQEAEDYDKTHQYNLQILDGNGNLLWELPDIGRSTMRGEAAGDAAVWICAEWWNTALSNGYLNGHLSKSVILLANLADGEMLFQAETGKNELYLTSRENLCYFYKMGKADRENAYVSCRDIRDWETEQVIYTFDYAVEPDIASYKDSMLKARFILDDDSIKVVWESTDRILTSEGKYQAERMYYYGKDTEGNDESVCGQSEVQQHHRDHGRNEGNVPGGIAAGDGERAGGGAGVRKKSAHVGNR